jgi:hypothetical protein
MKAKNLELSLQVECKRTGREGHIIAFDVMTGNVTVKWVFGMRFDGEGNQANETETQTLFKNEIRKLK